MEENFGKAAFGAFPETQFRDEARRLLAEGSIYMTHHAPVWASRTHGLTSESNDASSAAKLFVISLTARGLEGGVLSLCRRRKLSVVIVIEWESQVVIATAIPETLILGREDWMAYEYTESGLKIRLYNGYELVEHRLSTGKWCRSHNALGLHDRIGHDIATRIAS